MIDDLVMAKGVLEDYEPVTVFPPVGNVSGMLLFGAKWCRPCQMLKPLITKYVNYYVDLTLDNPTDVHSVPTLRAYVNGEVIGELVGPTSVDDVEEFYNQHIEEVITSMYVQYQNFIDAFDIESFYDTMSNEGDENVK